MKRRETYLGLVLALSVTVIIAGCATGPSRAEMLQRILELPTKSLSDYRFDPTTPLADRVGVASDSFVRYLNEFDRTDDYTAYSPTAKERELVRQNLELLPRFYRQILKDRLVGIYFINNFKGSGLTDYVLDDSEKIYAAMVLNPETMRHDISDWMTYRESTAFASESGKGSEFTIEIDCGHTYSGLTYVLLHEGSHIIDYVDNLTPYVDPSIRSLGLGVASTPFASRVWRSYAEPRHRRDFPLRSKIHFYGFGEPIPISRAEVLYRGLAGSPFVSLYGSENWAEDFAEYMTTYYLTHYLGQPYRIELYKKGKLDFEYDPMSSPRVLRRAAPVVQLLAH